jgi:sugar lactone lactonase YvrE
MKNKVVNLMIIAAVSAILPNCVSTTTVVQPTAGSTPTPGGSSNSPDPSVSLSPSPVPTAARATPVPGNSSFPTPEEPPQSTITPVPTPSPSLIPPPDIDRTQIAVSTVAGSSVGNFDPAETNLRLNNPTGIAIDSLGNLYVADTGSNKIRRIDPAGKLSTFAGSAQGYVDNEIATRAQFSSPTGLVIDSKNNIYVADNNNQRIRKITFGGVVTTFSGSGDIGFKDGTLTVATYNQPGQIIVDQDGALYISDILNSAIRKITTFRVTTLAGSGTPGHLDSSGSEAKFNAPQGLAVDNDNNIYVADSANHVIRKIYPDGRVTTIAGSAKNPGFTDGRGTEARFDTPMGITYTSKGDLYVTDSLNNRIRLLSPSGYVSTIAGSIAGFGDGSADRAMFSRPVGITSDQQGENLYVTDADNNRVRKITLEKLKTSKYY